MLKSKVYFGPVLTNLKIGNYGSFQIWDLSILSERAPSKLSEHHKFVEFGPPEPVTEPICLGPIAFVITLVSLVQ